MIKPDGVGRRLCGEVIRRYEEKGLKLVGMKMQVLSEELAREHYAEHAEKAFFDELLTFIMSGPTVQMVWEGRHAVDVVRKMNGLTNSIHAEPGTIRGDFGLTIQNNVVHASDSVETSTREIAIYFTEDELLDYALPDEHWLV